MAALLTIIYALVMMAVVVGVIGSIVTNGKYCKYCIILYKHSILFAQDTPDKPYRVK